MDDSPAGGLQPGEVPLPPEPCHPPGTGRPLPDLMAIRLAEVPDSWPPYDDEVAIAGAGQAMHFEQSRQILLDDVAIRSSSIAKVRMLFIKSAG